MRWARDDLGVVSDPFRNAAGRARVFAIDSTDATADTPDECSLSLAAPCGTSDARSHTRRTLSLMHAGPFSRPDVRWHPRFDERTLKRFAASFAQSLTTGASAFVVCGDHPAEAVVYSVDDDPCFGHSTIN